MYTRGITRRTLLASGSAALAEEMARPTATGTLLWASAQSQTHTLSGRVIWPGDPAYEGARQSFNARFSRFPTAIVVCDNTSDVQNAIRWARQEGIPLRARSGGHSYEAFSVVDNGLVIDVGGLDEVAVDLSRGEAVVGAGVRLLDLYRRLWEHGVTIPGGTCPGIGIAGLTLGGGIGFLSRQYGLTCDNLLAVDLVDADGEALRASEHEHADLFWALRGGGGGNFAVATAFTFRVHPIADVATCSVSWPWDDVAEVLDAWQRWAPFTDERLSVALAVAHPSAGTISATGLFTGPAVELPPLLEPLLQAGTPGAPAIQSLPFVTAAEQFAGPPIDSVHFKNASSLAYEPLSPAAIATLVDHLRAAPFASDLVGFFPLAWGHRVRKSGGDGVPPPPRALRHAIPGLLVGRRRCPAVSRLGPRLARGDGAIHNGRLYQLYRRGPPGLGNRVLRPEPRATHAGQGSSTIRTTSSTAHRASRLDRCSSSCDSSWRCSNRAHRRDRRQYCPCSASLRFHTSRSPAARSGSPRRRR